MCIFLKCGWCWNYVQFDSDEMLAYVFPHSVFREHFGHKHPKYSDTLLDYGFYLLNVDNICQSVVIYQVSYCKNYLKFGFFACLNKTFSHSLKDNGWFTCYWCVLPSDCTRYSAVSVWRKEYSCCNCTWGLGVFVLRPSVQLWKIR